MVITKEVLDRFFEEQEANPVDLNAFFEEASPFVTFAIGKTAALFLKEPGPQELATAFLTLFLLCYRQRNKSIKEWVESDFERVIVAEEEKEILKANTPWVEEQVGIAYPAFMLGVKASNLLAGAFFMVYTCIQMQKELTE